MTKENGKKWSYGCIYMSGETIEDTISLYEKEIKAYQKTVRDLERIYPDYPTLPTTRGTIKHFKKIVKWLKELQKYQDLFESPKEAEELLMSTC